MVAVLLQHVNFCFNLLFLILKRAQTNTHTQKINRHRTAISICDFLNILMGWWLSKWDQAVEGFAFYICLHPENCCCKERSWLLNDPVTAVLFSYLCFKGLMPQSQVQLLETSCYGSSWLLKKYNFLLIIQRQEILLWLCQFRAHCLGKQRHLFY